MTELLCRKSQSSIAENEQGSAAKSNRATYIEKIPEQIPTLETTTTIYPELDNQKGHA